jgi:hypothetical protein
VLIYPAFFSVVKQVKLRLLVDHGRVKSMYTEKFPEAVPPLENLKRLREAKE